MKLRPLHELYFLIHVMYHEHFKRKKIFAQSFEYNQQGGNAPHWFKAKTRPSFCPAGVSYVQYVMRTQTYGEARNCFRNTLLKVFLVRTPLLSIFGLTHLSSSIVDVLHRRHVVCMSE